MAFSADFPSANSKFSPSKMLRRRALLRGRRRLNLEQLESRNLMAMLPYGAQPDDLDEYMLGDVLVNVVLMESNPNMLTQDTNQEDWTAASIANVKGKIEEGINWWKETLHNVFPSVSDQLLNFTFDYTFADAPVGTGVEPINHTSTEYGTWVADFIARSGVASTGNVNADVRSFNHQQRLAHQSSWSFTIFVVNDEHDLDHSFLPAQGAHPQAFAFAADKFMVVPASRPAMTFAHETGHMFWAFDEYLGGDSYSRSRGYYNTPNTNASNNPAGSQQASIMADGVLRQGAYDAHISDAATLATIGWQDSDDDGIFDVLDVPFMLEGSGWYDKADSSYKFLGSSSVRTLLNRNPEGLGNDITINLIREVQYSVDGGEWQSYDTGLLPDYGVNLQVVVPVDPGTHEFKLRTVDTVTGAMSREYVVENIEIPGITDDYGLQGFVYWDYDNDSSYGSDDTPAVDFPVQIVDDDDKTLVLTHIIDPDNYPDMTSMDGVQPGVALSAVSGSLNDGQITGEVVAHISSTAGRAGNVFAAATDSSPLDTWNLDSRALRASFSQPQTTVSIRVWGGTRGTIGRLEGYNSAGELVARASTSVLYRTTDTVKLTISRTEGDIAYVLAGGDAGTFVVLDDLEWGATTRVTTDQRGAYWFPYLPDGTYHVKINVPHFSLATNPSGGKTDVQVSSSAPQTLSFGLVALENPWHNPASKFDVNNSGGAADISDILMQIHYYRQYPNQALPANSPNQNAFVDVDNDGVMSINDILQVISAYRTAHASPAPPSSTTETEFDDTSSGTTDLGSDGNSAGETAVHLDVVPCSEDNDEEPVAEVAVADSPLADEPDASSTATAASSSTSPAPVLTFTDEQTDSADGDEDLASDLAATVQWPAADNLFDEWDDEEAQADPLVDEQSAGDSPVTDEVPSDLVDETLV